MKKHKKVDYLHFIEDVASLATRHELYYDDTAIVPTYEERSQELDALIHKARDFLEGIED